MLKSVHWDIGAQGRRHGTKSVMARHRGVATGGIWVYIPPPPPKKNNFYTPKNIPGYAPDQAQGKRGWGSEGGSPVRCRYKAIGLLHSSLVKKIIFNIPM